MITLSPILSNVFIGICRPLYLASCWIGKGVRRGLYLDAAVYVYRATVNFTTGVSPFEALYGRKPEKPLEIILNLDKNVAYKDERFYKMHITKALKEAYAAIQSNQLQMALKNARLRQLTRMHLGIGFGCGGNLSRGKWISVLTGLTG